ncbi:HOOK protein-domain-containing protein [Auriculariales sp. MPI-PUGE-AT-0066]|nr:HOOK protein-domain-containing protein [Auriculariales sp. MPI-PUGE-AT-0066]
MSTESRREFDAFKAFFASFELSQPVDTPADLADGVALYDFLAVVDADYFGKISKPAVHHADNWALRFNSLKRLFRLMNQYYADVLHQPTTAIEVPNLQAIAQDYNIEDTLALCRLAIAIAVQGEKNKSVIERIQTLNGDDQHALMRAIEQVRRHPSDDHYYEIQAERSRILNEKETLVKVYQTLLEEHRTLQTNLDDVTGERDDALSRLRQAQREQDNMRGQANPDVHLRAEIDHLRGELSKSEDSLAGVETDLEKQVSRVSDLERKVDELQEKADEAVRLKDQVDEYRHAAEKLQKTENVMEKYKKKLEESADLRRQVKSLEEQNSSLVDKNAALEEEFRKVAAFKPLMESYKTQVTELESKHAQRSKENDVLKHELENAKIRLKITSEERQKDSEALELYQERVRELELMAHRPAPKTVSTIDSANTTANEDDLLEELSGGNQSLGGEMDDAITGTTTTDLKLRIRQLERDLEAAQVKQADGSRVLVLENLLDDANRMKARYEKDYLAEHRSKLVLQTELDEIRSGKALGDGAEANIALRQRLNEVVDSLEELKRHYAELEVKNEAQTKELVVTKSDLNLVNKDQLEILATLRESVNEDKVELEQALDKVKQLNRELQDKIKMQLEQINSLLMEKVTMQGEGISQRERMLERERDFGDLRASLAGRDLPPDIKNRMLSQHEEIVRLSDAHKAAQDKLTKARTLLKTQDKMIKEGGPGTGAASSDFEGGDEALRSQLKILEDESARYKRIIREMVARYKHEQELMLSKLIEHGNTTMRTLLGAHGQRAGPERTAWLSQQRNNTMLLLHTKYAHELPLYLIWDSAGDL